MRNSFVADCFEQSLDLPNSEDTNSIFGESFPKMATIGIVGDPNDISFDISDDAKANFSLIKQDSPNISFFDEGSIILGSSFDLEEASNSQCDITFYNQKTPQNFKNLSINPNQNCEEGIENIENFIEFSVLSTKPKQGPTLNSESKRKPPQRIKADKKKTTKNIKRTKAAIKQKMLSKMNNQQTLAEKVKRLEEKKKKIDEIYKQKADELTRLIQIEQKEMEALYPYLHSASQTSNSSGSTQKSDLSISTFPKFLNKQKASSTLFGQEKPLSATQGTSSNVIQQANSVSKESSHDSTHLEKSFSTQESNKGVTLTQTKGIIFRHKVLQIISHNLFSGTDQALFGLKEHAYKKKMIKKIQNRKKNGNKILVDRLHNESVNPLKSPSPVQRRPRMPNFECLQVRKDVIEVMDRIDYFMIGNEYSYFGREPG